MSQTQTDRAARVTAFRALHEGPGAFVIPNPWDAGTSRILTAIGFKALATTSAGLAFALGRRDGSGMVSRDEALANARAIVEATHLPVSADLENCYADAPAAAAETIPLAAASGLAGCSIEDASGDPAQPIYAFNHAVERVAAAVEAARRVSGGFVLTARAENFLHGRADLDDTLRRLQAYEKAGADVLYAPALPGLEVIRTVCSAVSKPVNVLVGGRATDLTVAALQAAGVRRISVGSGLNAAALGAFVRAARELHDQGSFGYAAAALSHGDASAFMAAKGAG